MDINASDDLQAVLERYADEILSLPVYPELSDGQVDFIAEKVREFAPGRNTVTMRKAG